MSANTVVNSSCGRTPNPIMKVLCLLAIFALTVSAIPIEQHEERENGENGWYVPQLDGTFEWMTIEEGEALIESIEAVESYGLITNTVHFYLFTKLNPTKGEQITEAANSIIRSNFNKAHPTRFVIHGWTQSYTSPMNKEICAAFFSVGNYNCIVVDWVRARQEYATSAGAVKSVGKKVATMVDVLAQNHGMPMSSLHIIGHSLGAHVAGHTGKNVKAGQIDAIVGLDTALPLFSYKKTKKRLCDTDAFYVEAIHTNGDTLGFLKPVGSSDFYPNGGKTQPGCPLDVTGACSHGKSTTYYAESVKSNNFHTVKCENYKDATKNNCGGTYSSVKMGSESNKVSAKGEYFVPVNTKSPYGMG